MGEVDQVEALQHARVGGELLLCQVGEEDVQALVETTFLVQVRVEAYLDDEALLHAGLVEVDNGADLGDDVDERVAIEREDLL